MLVYCDYIAHLISTELKAIDTERLLSSVGPVRWHLAEAGTFASTRKTVHVQDRYGKKYVITVEQTE